MVKTTSNASAEWKPMSKKAEARLSADEAIAYFDGMGKYAATKMKDAVERKKKEREELAKEIGTIILDECPGIADDLAELRRFAEEYSFIDHPIGSSDGSGGEAETPNPDDDDADEIVQMDTDNDEVASPIGMDAVNNSDAKSTFHGKLPDSEEVKENINWRRPLNPNGTPIQGGRGAKSPKTVSVSGRKNVQSDSGTDRDRKPNGTASRNDNDAKTPSAMEVYGVKNGQSDISTRQANVPIGTGATNDQESDWAPGFTPSNAKPAVPFPT